jgi:hypothetical protein
MGEASLQICLLGTPELTWNDAPLSVPSSLKVRSLLAYVIFHQDCSISRICSSGLFWPERPDDRAKRSPTPATVTLYHEIVDALADVDVSHLPVRLAVVPGREIGDGTNNLPCGGESNRRF